MNRLLIIPMMLWSGLFTQAQQIVLPQILGASQIQVLDNALTNGTVTTELSPPALEKVDDVFSRRKKIIHKNGIYQGYHDNGELQFSANIKKHRLQGTWKSWYDDGSICDSGKFVKDVPDGEWRGWYADGTLKYIWHFSAGKYLSLKEEMLSQPKQIFFRIAHLPLQEGVKFFKTDYIFDATKHTPRVMFRGKTLNLKNFDPEDLKLRADKNTITDDYIPPFPECLFHGKFVAYYPDGRLKEEGRCINGMKDGLWEEHYVNGSKARGSYHYGKKSGEWRIYNAKGKLVSYKRYRSSGLVSDAFDFPGGE